MSPSNSWCRNWCQPIGAGAATSGSNSNAFTVKNMGVGLDFAIGIGPTGLAPYGYLNVDDRTEPIRARPEKARTTAEFRIGRTGAAPLALGEPTRTGAV